MNVIVGKTEKSNGKGRCWIAENEVGTFNNLARLKTMVLAVHWGWNLNVKDGNRPTCGCVGWIGEVYFAVGGGRMEGVECMNEKRREGDMVATVVSVS